MQLIDVQQWRTVAAGLPHWHYQEAGGGLICRELLFDDFVQAFSFMTRGALLAERQGHHPDWWNAYNRVRIELSTHDVGGLTSRDLALAQAIDRAYLAMVA